MQRALKNANLTEVVKWVKKGKFRLKKKVFDGENYAGKQE